MQVVSTGEDVLLMDGPAGVLEVRVDRPLVSDRGMDLLVAHPHPLHGGTMHNKVVHTLARAAREEGVRAVRFNFRGVGRSAGVHDQGRGEVDDLLAVREGLARQEPGRPCLLAGFSFGAWVAAMAAVRCSGAGSPPPGLLLVAPPVYYTGFDSLPALPLPVDVFMGNADEVVPPDAVREWARRTPMAVSLHWFSATHFFHGELGQLKQATAEWLRRRLPPEPAGQ